jgi:hypothetical protein
LNVLDDNLFHVQTLSFGVAFSIFKEREEEFGRLLGPATLSGSPSLGLSTTANTTVKTEEGNTLLVLLDVFKETLSLLQGHTLQNHGGLVGVLEMNTEVRTLSVAGLGEVFRFVRVHLKYINSGKRKID